MNSSNSISPKMITEDVTDTNLKSQPNRSVSVTHQIVRQFRRYLEEKMVVSDIPEMMTMLYQIEK